MLDLKIYGNIVQVYGTKSQKVFYSGSLEECRKYIKKVRARVARKAKHQAMLDLGLVRVKGSLGGVYYE